ncbi:DeoR/GlpR transcriptional regulator [Micrococcales bacterium 31B]|nr:DeoR/GlpR transcriptional regulator [Micrococcales bacterium 31B]
MVESSTAKSQRWEPLLSLLSERKRLSVQDVVDQLGISPSTVRRDFSELASLQLAKRVHGGIVATEVAYEIPSRYRKNCADDSRIERIAAAAMDLVGPGDCIAFNGGTTTTAAARALALRADLIGPPGDYVVTVVTNAVNIATELVLRPHIRTVMLGGVVRPKSFETVGPLAMHMAAELTLDYTFFGVMGAQPEFGLSCGEDSEMGVVKALQERSQHSVAITTSEKFTRTSFTRICGFEDIDLVITDDGIDADVAARVRDTGVDLRIV